MSIAEALEAYNQAINASIFANPDFNRKTKGNEGANASGNFASFIISKTAGSTSTVESNGQTIFTKYGTSYTKALDFGQAPGAMAGLERDLYEWLVYQKYNLRWETEEHRHSLAKYLAKKIEKFGTYKHRKPEKQTAIISTALSDAYPVLLEKLAEAFVSSIDVNIKQTINASIPNI